MSIEVETNKSIDQPLFEKSLKELRLESDRKYEEILKIKDNPTSSKYQRLKRELLELQVQRKELALRG